MEVTVADLYALVEPPRTLGTSAPDTPTNARGRSLEQSEWVQLRRSYECLDAKRRQLAMEFLQMLERMQRDEEPHGEQRAASLSSDEANDRRESSLRNYPETGEAAAAFSPLPGTRAVTLPALRILAAAGESR